MPTPNDYGQSLASYYDSIYGAFTADIAFYVEEAEKSGGPVLELGCGTGRVTLPIARAGIQVTGLDISPEMLEIAEGKCEMLSEEEKSRITFVRGDMEQMDLDGKYPLVIIPFRAFLHLLTPEAERTALLAIRKHLTLGGRLILSIFDPSVTVITAHSGSARNTLHKREQFELEDGLLVIWEAREYDATKQIIRSTRILEEFDPGNVSRKRTHSEITLRYVFRYEMQYLAELCGYRVSHLYGDFEKGPFRHGGEQVWVFENT